MTRFPTNRRRHPADDDERHSLSVHLMGTRLIAMCRCGAIIGGHREQDSQQMSLLDLLELTRIHNSNINNRR